MKRQRLLTRFDELLIAWAFFTSCPGSIRAQVVPMASDWPETRGIQAIWFDPVVDSLIAMWHPADTLERAQCLYGDVAQRHGGATLRVLRSESPVTVEHVHHEDGRVGLKFTCRAAPDYVGYAHTHPYYPAVDTWLRSQEDAAHLAWNDGGLLQIIVPAWGWVTYFLRDGRFGAYRLEVGS